MNIKEIRLQTEKRGELTFQNLLAIMEATNSALKRQAVKSVNNALVVRNWFLGRYIFEFEQRGADRAKYGEKLLTSISRSLTKKGLKGFSISNLKLFRQFYATYPVKDQTLMDHSIGQTLSDQFTLDWSHYTFLIQIENIDERRFYEIEAASEGWSMRELKRQFNSSLYERLALSRNSSTVKALSKKGHILESAGDVIKSPYILEFLDLDEKSGYSENDLETAIIDKLEQFLLELGKGFLFEARQKRFTFKEEHFYVDLVFYNRLLKCYVLVDLKIGKIVHQDLGQLQMYVNYYDRYVRTDGENPTIGILLCKTKNDAMVELALPKQNKTIFASQYKLYLPSKAELKKQLKSFA